MRIVERLREYADQTSRKTIEPIYAEEYKALADLVEAADLGQLHFEGEYCIVKDGEKVRQLQKALAALEDANV